jgi:hypothetical protein
MDTILRMVDTHSVVIVRPGVVHTAVKFGSQKNRPIGIIAKPITKHNQEMNNENI